MLKRKRTIMHFVVSMVCSPDILIYCIFAGALIGCSAGFLNAVKIKVGSSS